MGEKIKINTWGVALRMGQDSNRNIETASSKDRFIKTILNKDGNEKKSLT